MTSTRVLFVSTILYIIYLLKHEYNYICTIYSTHIFVFVFQ